MIDIQVLQFLLIEFFYIVCWSIGLTFIFISVGFLIYMSMYFLHLFVNFIQKSFTKLCDYNVKHK